MIAKHQMLLCYAEESPRQGNRVWEKGPMLETQQANLYTALRQVCVDEHIIMSTDAISSNFF